MPTRIRLLFWILMPLFALTAYFIFDLEFYLAGLGHLIFGGYNSILASVISYILALGIPMIMVVRISKTLGSDHRLLFIRLAILVDCMALLIFTGIL